MRSSSAPNTRPSSSRSACTQSTSKTPAKAPEATIGGGKRAPSSFVQHTSSSGPRGPAPRAATGRRTPRAARTAPMPSYFPTGPPEGREVVVGAGPAREDVADAVDRHGAAGLGTPGDEEVAHLLVGVGEGQTPEAAGLAGADLAGAHDGGPEPRGVDGDSLAAGHRS